MIIIAVLVTSLVHYTIYNTSLVKLKEDYWKLVKELNYTKTLLDYYRDKYIVLERSCSEVRELYNITVKRLKEIETKFVKYNNTMHSIVEEVKLRQKVQHDFIDLLLVAALQPENKAKITERFLKLEYSIKATNDEEMIKFWNFLRKELMKVKTKEDVHAWLEGLFKLILYNQYEVEKQLELLFKESTAEGK